MVTQAVWCLVSMSLDTSTGRFALVDEILQRDHQTSLEAFLRSRREWGRSFELVARELSELVRVPGFTVSYQTVRRWCQRLQIEVAS